MNLQRNACHMEGIRVSGYKTSLNHFILEILTYRSAIKLTRNLMSFKKLNLRYLYFKICPGEGKLCLYKDQHAMSSAAVIAIIMQISSTVPYAEVLMF